MIKIWQSIVIVLIFAVIFGIIEYQFLKPLDPVQNPQEKPILHKAIYRYHLVLLFLYSTVSLISIYTLKLHWVAKIGAAFAQLCTILLIEDLTWFLMRLLSGQGILMQSTDWTSQHIGFIDTGLGFVIPVWYVIGIPLVIGIWILVWRFGREI